MSSGRFKPGQSGNPSGKPKGARNRLTLACEALLEGEGEALTRKAIELALDGDTVALRLCLERICPPAKERPISIELPDINGTDDIGTASNAVLASLANGELLPSEAAAVATLLEGRRKAIETEELESRITALENRK